MNSIARLREIGQLDFYTSYYREPSQDAQLFEEVLNILYDAILVDHKFEDYGRWSNFETNIYKLIEGENVAYFTIGRELPATEMQEGGEFERTFYEVEPYEVVTTVYKKKVK